MTLGVEFAYELLKLHFWLALMVLSFIYDIASSSSYLSGPIPALQEAVARESVFDNFFSDPLGIKSGFKL